MARKAILSICRTCREPKPGKAFRRNVDKMRHDSCIVCEDAIAAVKRQRVHPVDTRKRAYNAKRYQALKGAPVNRHVVQPSPVQTPIVRTHWIGGYPGVQA